MDEMRYIQRQAKDRLASEHKIERPSDSGSINLSKAAWSKWYYCNPGSSGWLDNCSFSKRQIRKKEPAMCLQS